MTVSLPSLAARVCNASVPELQQRATCHRSPGTRSTVRRKAPAHRRAGHPRAIEAATLTAVTKQPVELHVISDSTGETAVRLVHALEAQFPGQEFEEIRHPRVETVDDLQLAVNRARGRRAVVVYTLVKPEMREAMRMLCRRAKLHYCDLL